MKKLVLLVWVLAIVGWVQAQDVQHNAWENAQTDVIRFAIPADWVQVAPGTVADAQQNIVVRLESTCPADEETINDWADATAETIAADADAQLLSRETLALPLGEAIRITWEANAAWNADFYTITDETCLAVRASAPEEAPIVERIVNTISWMDARPDEGWLLQADVNLVVTLRTPPSWQKLPVQNSLMVRETFDEVLVQVQYRDMGGTTNVEALQPQFDELYQDRGFVIADVQVLNIPAGDVLLYRLESVQIGNNAPQTQFQAALMRDNFLILATFGADERYFDEYEQTLLQMLDTLTFNAARVP